MQGVHTFVYTSEIV